MSVEEISNNFPERGFTTFSSHERGFTLIELLIVVSIIAILSVIGLTSYTNFLKNSRDAKRQSDLKFIQSALEQYFADQKYYPFTVTSDNPISFGNRTYLTKVPSDPKTTPPYLYQARGTSCAQSTPQNCNNYCIFMKLEATDLADDPLCSPSGDYNYGIAKP